MRKFQQREAMSQMQLMALGLTLHLGKARFCRCLQLWCGGVFLGCCLLLRSACNEFAGLSIFKVAVQELFGATASEAAATVEAAADAAAAIACLLGVLVTSGIPVAVQVLWLILRAGGEALALAASLALALPGLGRADALRLGLLAGSLAFDLYALFVSGELMLFLELRSKVSPSTHQIVAAAQHVALASLPPGGWGCCHRRHLVVALLLDPDIRELLRVAGVPVDRLEADLSTAAGLDIVGEREQKLLQVGLPLAPDLQATIMDAAVLQEKAGDGRLRADHLLLALCAGGELEVELGAGGGAPSGAAKASCAVDVGAVRRQLEAVQAHVRAGRPAEGAPGALVLGCLPLEETVAVWAALGVAVEAVSIGFLVVVGRGWGPMTGMRRSKHLYMVEIFEGLLGIACNVLGLLGIHGHRRARNEVREAAYCLGSRWDADLDEAFGAVRREPQAGQWYRLLKRGADWTAVLWLWTILDLLLDVPVLGMSFAEGNLCGAYAGGLAAVTSAGSALPTALVHCSPRDLALLAGEVVALLAKAYACWVVMALWHEYAHGWTTTDLRGLSLVTPFSLLRVPLAKVLAGMPRWAQRTLGVEEATPLLL